MKISTSSPIAPADSTMQQIVESGNEGIWLFDLDGRTVYVNERMASMLDYTIEEMASISLLDVLDEVGRDQGADFLARQRQAGGTTESVESLLLRRGGEPIWTAVRHSPWQDEDGTLLGVIAFIDDITEQRRLGEALRRREEQLAEAQRVARLGSWEWIFETRELHCSDEMYRIFQRSSSQLHDAPNADHTFAQQTYLTLLDPDDLQRTSEIVRRCLDEQLPGFEFEHRIGRKPSSQVWVRASGEVLRDEAGRPTMIRGTALDITAYKESEERLRRATSRHQLLQTMAATANEARTLEEVVRVGLRQMCTQLHWLSGRGYLVSDQAASLLPAGFWRQPDPVQPSGKPSDVQVGTRRPSAVSELAIRARETGQAQWTTGSDLADPTAAADQLQTFAVPVLARREVVAVLEFVAEQTVDLAEALAICHEVAGQLSAVADRQRARTELQRARDTALDALKAKSEFLATMSHEIRTPMNGVIGLTELLLATRLDGQQRQYVAGLQTAGEALLSIINDILDFSRNETGVIELNIVDVDVSQLIREVAGLLTRQAQAKGLELITREGLGPTAPLRGDPTRLRQVLLNLTANAIKFTDTGEVVVSARITAGSKEAVDVTFEVLDTGIGISPEDQQRIFEPFSQVDASTTRRFGGTGLGLAISRQLVETMGAELTVDSEPGRGSVFAFTIRMPRAAESRDPAPTPAAHETRPRGSRGHILVVEDNTVNQLVVRGLVDRLGFTTDLANNGIEALDAVDGCRYSAVLMDCQMPGMDGYSATAEIRRREGTSRHTPIIALTAGALTGDEERCLEAGMDAYLPKPVDSTSLESVLNQLVTDVPLGTES